MTSENGHAHANGQSKTLFGNRNVNTLNKLTTRELVVKYLHYLPLFLTCIGICIGVTFIYLRYKNPVYTSSIKVLVKDDRKSGTDLSTQILSEITGTGRSNIANELELVKSAQLMEKVVRKQHLNVVYYSRGKVRQMELYDPKQKPFVVFTRIGDSSKIYQAAFEVVDNTIIYQHNGKSQQVVNNTEVRSAAFDFFVQFGKLSGYRANYTYKAVWYPSFTMGSMLASQVNADALNKDASIMLLSFQNESGNKGRDILNGLAREYGLSNVQEKNRTIDNTLQFIDERLLLISGELGGVENNLKDFRQENNVIDVPTQGQQELSKLADLKDRLDQSEVRMQVTDMVSSYVDNPARKFSLVPSSLGIEDATLLDLIRGYNADVLKREELLKTVAAGNIAVVTIENELDQLRNKIIENIANIKSTYRNSYNLVKAEYDQVLGSIHSIPQKQKSLIEIERQQGIKEKLYLFLLEKREESAITRASAVSNSVAVDPAVTNPVPVKPQPTTLYTLAVLLGILLPAGLIYMRDLMNDKITTRDDIITITTAPIIGEVNHKSAYEPVLLEKQSRGVIAEQFRIIRTNLPYFLQGKGGGSILITSTMQGEGKTFSSMNLGAVLSLSGKRVVLLEFDLRKPTITTALGIDNESQGITTFLTANAPLQNLLKPINQSSNYYLLPTGPIPPNPAELLLSDKMETLFAELKNQFDYLIIDSPPIGVVSDAKVLAKYSDINLYILRQRYTPKKYLELVNELYTEQTLPNMALVVNDVVLKGAYGYYGYSSAYGYGNAYHYDYSSSNGYNNDNANGISKWKQLVRRK